jgi:hypothetical protein
MKLKLIILLTTFVFAGCQQLSNLTTPKPVQIDGLGSLVSLKDKSLNERQLTKIVKAVVKQNRVNLEDAKAMLNIYQRQSNDFLNASNSVNKNDEVLSMKDVEPYLMLLLQHESLRQEANLATQVAITQEVSRTAHFNDNENSGLRENAGNLAGSYVNAAVQTVAQKSEEKRAIYENQQAANKFNLIEGFEQTAVDITQGKKENILPEEGKNAEQFLADLRDYNESLPASAKILDANGRLVNPSQMSDRQKDSMEDIFGTSNPAGGRLSARMNAIYDKLANATERQVKN